MNAGELVGFGLLLGFSLTVPPGPMNALIVAASTRSFRAGFVTGLGAMTADAILAAVVFTVAGAVDVAVAIRPIDAAGAVALAYFGVRQLVRPPTSGPMAATAVRTYAQSLAVGVTNPFQIVWWLTAGLAVVRFGGAVLLLALFAAVAIWVVVLPLAVARGVEARPRAARAVSLGAGAILLGFAAYFAFLAVV